MGNTFFCVHKVLNKVDSLCFICLGGGGGEGRFIGTTFYHIYLIQIYIAASISNELLATISVDYLE